MTTTLESGTRQVFLDAVLRPHRSLPPRGFHLLMLGLGLLSVGVGVGSVLVGAWPIVGFFGLDVALVYLALRLSYRAGRQSECVRLTEESLTVERVSIHGDRRLFRFEPFWLRLVYRDDADNNSLTLASHGKFLVVGSFLAPEARRNFAQALGDALRRWRAFATGHGAQ